MANASWRGSAGCGRTTPRGSRAARAWCARVLAWMMKSAPPTIPGVAQRTGATTYYIEILPASPRELAGRRPVLSLIPGVGDIDLLVASELMEAARVVAAGFVTPERTLTIASTSRFYVIGEKI